MLLTMFRNAFFVFGGLVALGFAAAVFSAAQQHGQREHLESIVLPTAHGYAPQVSLPEDLRFGLELARFGGRPVYAGSLEPRELEKEELVALTSGRPGEPLIFERPTQREEERPVQHYLMISETLFLRVHQGPEGNHFSSGVSVTEFVKDNR